MQILALDSSGLVASIAIVEEEQTLVEYTMNYKMTHSQTLLPMLAEVTDMMGFDLSEIDAIAVSGGPGSFTGLRIGAATAKGLGLALDKPLIQVPTLAGLAYNLLGREELICPIMDARRNQVYTGIYRCNDDLEVVEEQAALEIEKLIEMLNGFKEKVTFLGDGVPVYQEIIEEKMTVPFAFAPLHMNRQRAASVAALGIRYYKKGQQVTAADYKPDYLRLSQAERELLEKEGQSS